MSRDRPESPRRHSAWTFPLRFLRARLLIGVEFLAPFVITYIVAAFLIDFITDTSQPLFREWFGYDVPGLGFALLFGTPLLFGTLALHLFGTRAMLAIEATATRLPVIGSLFAVSHQIVSAFGGDDQTGFRTVVSVEYPRRGVWTLGFFTRVCERDEGELMAMVYLPSPPAPHSGVLILLPIADVRQVDIGVDDLMKTLLSVGIAAPDKLPTRPLAAIDGVR